jgi:hypothetical protein
MPDRDNNGDTQELSSSQRLRKQSSNRPSIEKTATGVTNQPGYRRPSMRSTSLAAFRGLINNQQQEEDKQIRKKSFSQPSHQFMQPPLLQM